MKIDLVFLIVLVVVVAYLFVLHKVEAMGDVGNSEQVKDAIRQVYLADVESIRNLSNVATKLQAGGITVPGQLTVTGQVNSQSGDNHIPIIAQSNVDSHIQLKTKNDDGKNVYLINRDGHFKVHAQGVGDMFGVNHDGHHYVRHLGDNAMHVEGDGNNPFVSLGKTGTCEKKKLYIQNADAHTENPTFRVGIHGDRMLMNMNKSHGVFWPRKDGRNTHFDWEDGKNYIRGETINDGNLHVNGGKICINGKCIDENHLSMLVDGFKLQTADGGWHSGAWMHTHKDGVMRIADPQYRTVYLPRNRNT